jgi:hypothetical protein
MQHRASERDKPTDWTVTGTSASSPRAPPDKKKYDSLREIVIAASINDA